MRPYTNKNRLQIILACLAVVLTAWPCAAQDSYGNGAGYTPMAPASTTSSGTLNQSVVPGPPIQVNNAIRPNTWPGAPQNNSSPWPNPNPADVVPAGEVKPCDGTRILGRVGSEVILESEVAGMVNEIIEANKDRIPADQLEKQRTLLIQQRLKTLIETKLIYQDAKRTIPAEGWSQVEKHLEKQFEEVELENLTKKAGVSSAHELDVKFRSLGTSLEREKRAFCERTLAQQWIHQQVKRDEEITYDQMVRYYREHQGEFTRPARARWEELMVRYSSHPTKAAAFDAIAQLGNQVFAGAPLAEVAKKSSGGATAEKGGGRDWTSKGSLACEKIDVALFTLPVGQLSQIIEGPTGFHIVRVTERNDPLVRPFLEAQVDIKQKIVQQRTQKQFRDYMAMLEARTPIWKSPEYEITSTPPPCPIR